MILEDYLYLGLRGLFCALWLLSAARCFRHARVQPPGQRRLVAAAAVLLFLLAAVLSVHDGWVNAVLQPGEPIGLVNWLWMGFDGLAPILSLWLVAALQERDAANRQLLALAMTDPLTGLANRRGFEERSLAALAAARRAGQPATVLMLDLDHFKRVNDGHGHAAGDAVLAAFAAVLRGTLRGGDIPGRLGGEEFAALLPGTGAEAAQALAERLRLAVRRGVPHPAGPDAVVSVSIGVAVAVPAVGPRALPEALEQALAAADAALYAAKRGGRDRVVLADGAAPLAAAA